MMTHFPQVLSEVQPENILVLDEKPFAVTRPSGAYGLDSNRILEDVMGTDERPEKIKRQLHDLFRTIDGGKLVEARKMLSEITDSIGADPELVKAGVLIRRKEVLGR